MAGKSDRAPAPRTTEPNTLILQGIDKLRSDVKTLIHITKATGNMTGGQSTPANVWPPGDKSTPFTDCFARIVQNKKSNGLAWGKPGDAAMEEAAQITSFLLQMAKVIPPSGTALPVPPANSLLSDVHNLVAGNPVPIGGSGQQPSTVQLFGGWPSESTKTYWEIVVALGIMLNQIADGSTGSGKQLPPP